MLRTRLPFAGVLTLVALLATGGAGLFGMWQSNHGLKARQTADAAMCDRRPMDMLHGGKYASVARALLYAERDAAAGDVESNAAPLNVKVADLAGLPAFPAEFARLRGTLSRARSDRAPI